LTTISRGRGKEEGIIPYTESPEGEERATPPNSRREKKRQFSPSKGGKGSVVILTDTRAIGVSSRKREGKRFHKAEREGGIHVTIMTRGGQPLPRTGGEEALKKTTLL